MRVRKREIQRERVSKTEGWRGEEKERGDERETNRQTDRQRETLEAQELG